MARSSEVLAHQFAAGLVALVAVLLAANRSFADPTQGGPGDGQSSPVYERKGFYAAPGFGGPAQVNAPQQLNGPAQFNGPQFNGAGNGNPGPGFGGGGGGQGYGGPGQGNGGSGPGFNGAFGGGRGGYPQQFGYSQQFSGGWFQRPYPYHLDYYKMRYGGSYAPYYGNLYGPSNSFYPAQYNGDYGPGYGGQNYPPSGNPPYASNSNGHWAWCWVPGQSDAPVGPAGSVEYPATRLPEGAADQSSGPAITAPANNGTANNVTTMSPSSAPKH